jgi:hypothetical protein
MGTIKPYNSDEMRVKASERIHSMFKNVPFIYIKYRDTYAEGYCQYKDGLVVSFTVWYRDLLIRTSEEEPESPHEKAVEYINSIPERPWAS